jgi:hypothetical protein
LTPTPNITTAGDAQNELTGVSAHGPNDVWASAFADNVNGENLAEPYLVHWTGKSWVIVKVPNPNSKAEGSRFNAVDVLSAGDVWAVGQTQKNNGSILSLTEQYNGSVWTVVPSPDPGMNGKLFNNSLDAVGGAGGRNLIALGARETTGQCCLRTLGLETSQG